MSRLITAVLTHNVWIVLKSLGPHQHALGPECLAVLTELIERVAETIEALFLSNVVCFANPLGAVWARLPQKS